MCTCPSCWASGTLSSGSHTHLWKQPHKLNLHVHGGVVKAGWDCSENGAEIVHAQRLPNSLQKTVSGDQAMVPQGASGGFQLWMLPCQLDQRTFCRGPGRDNPKGKSEKQNHVYPKKWLVLPQLRELHEPGDQLQEMGKSLDARLQNCSFHTSCLTPPESLISQGSRKTRSGIQSWRESSFSHRRNTKTVSACLQKRACAPLQTG